MSNTMPDTDDTDADRTTDHSADLDPPADPGGDVADRVRRRSEDIAERQVQEALRKLEARGDLTESQRRVVGEMADGIVESLVAAPARTVQTARAADDETLRTVVELFDPDTDR